MNLSAKLTAHWALLSTFSAIIGTAFIQFLTQLVFARELGPNSVGVYFIAIAAHRVVEAISPLGLPMALTREVSTFKSSDAWPSARKLTSRTTIYCCMLGTIGALLINMLTYLAGAFLSLDPEALLATRIAALAGPPACMGLALTVLTITLPVMYILVLHFGGIGAAIATSTALSARAIMQFVAAKRYLGVAVQP